MEREDKAIMKTSMNKNKNAKTLGRTQISRNLRQKQTSAERVLWRLLRTHKIDGLKFHRQHPLGKFIADFYCPELRLVIELDGGVHKKTAEQDQARDEAIAQHQVRVIRWKNKEVLNQTEEALKNKIRNLTQETSLQLSPRYVERAKKDLSLGPSPYDVARESRQEQATRLEVKGGARVSNPSPGEKTSPQPSPHDVEREELPIHSHRVQNSQSQAGRLIGEKDATVINPSPGYVERESAAGGRERRECEICGKPLLASQPVLVIASRKVYKDKNALAIKDAQFACHAKCWEQIEDEDI